MATTLNGHASAGRALQGARVLFVLPTLGLAGAERQALNLARHLKTHHQADVRLVSLTAIDSMAAQCEEAQIPYEFFALTHGYRSRLGHLKDLLRFAWFVRQRKIDILLPYCMFQNILGGLTWRLAGAQVCIWNQRDEGRSRLEPWIEGFAVQQVPRFISNSQHGAHFLQFSLNVPASKIHVIPNGLEAPVPTVSRAEHRRSLGIPGDAFVATMVANLHAKKDHPTLIRAWRRVVDAWQLPGRPFLLLAGAFHGEHAKLVQLVEDLRLQDEVRFLGEVHAMGNLLAASDLAAFSSFNEGVPNAVLEAMAFGLAVVATDCPAIREALGPEGVVLLARAKDDEEMAKKILLAAGDPALRARLGAYGQQRAVTEFGIDEMGRRMATIIQSEWSASE